jgi:hypothetical protein
VFREEQGRVGFHFFGEIGLRDLLKDPVVIGEMSRAWQASGADDPANRHEEAGYIVQNPDGSVAVERWPPGEQSRIAPPPLDSPELL